MRYCERCRLLCQGEKCPDCGKGRLRSAEPDDPVLLTEENFIRSSMLEPLLEQANVPFSKVGGLGSGIAALVGYSIDSYRFFVPFGAWDEAQAVLQVLEGAGEDGFDEQTLDEEAKMDGAEGMNDANGAECAKDDEEKQTL